MLKVADGRSVQRVVAQPPLLGKGLSKVNDSRQRYQAYDKLLIGQKNVACMSILSCLYVNR